LLDHPTEMLKNIPADRPDLLRLAARVQIEETKMRGKDVQPARAAQDLVMSLWRQVLLARKRSLALKNKSRETAEITMQLQALKKGWVHAADFMVA
jgi:hypothetical protein